MALYLADCTEADGKVSFQALVEAEDEEAVVKHLLKGQRNGRWVCRLSKVRRLVPLRDITQLSGETADRANIDGGDISASIRRDRPPFIDGH